ncbi:hypothetical protein C5S53_08580 [Methanophagales archaeon]|nr:hypothetical protein C5S53_08580 [Methanophagales archaeon]
MCQISELEEKITALETREEARAPYDDKMTELMKRLIVNPEIKELIKKELGEVKDEKTCPSSFSLFMWKCIKTLFQWCF